MTKSQKLAVRASEIRSRLNELNGNPELSDDDRAEMAKLGEEYGNVETEWRGATIAETDELETRTATDDSEGRERRELRNRASVGTYLRHAHSGQPVAGIEAELNAAENVATIGPNGGALMPWAALEVRAADVISTTAVLDGPVAQKPILQRIFGRDLMGALGVRIDSPPAGRSEWNLLTGGVAPAMTAEGVAKFSEAPAFGTATLKPKRLTGAYRWTVEQTTEVPGLEQSLRTDLASAVLAAMSNQALNGTGADGQVNGLLSRVAAPMADPSAATTFNDFASLAAQAVDGLHSESEGENTVILGVDSYKYGAAVYASNLEITALQMLGQRAAGVRATTFMPAAASNIQTVVVHAGRDTLRGDSIAAVWPAMEVIRDPYSSASEGETRLTWIALWDLYAAFRAAAYHRAKVRTA